jgi:hypothetical protein
VLQRLEAADGTPNCSRVLVYSSVLALSCSMIPSASAPSATFASSTTACIRVGLVDLADDIGRRTCTSFMTILATRWPSIRR